MFIFSYVFDILCFVFVSETPHPRPLSQGSNAIAFSSFQLSAFIIIPLCVKNPVMSVSSVYNFGFLISGSWFLVHDYGFMVTGSWLRV